MPETIFLCGRFSEKNDKHHALFENLSTPNISLYIFHSHKLSTSNMFETYSVDPNINVEIYNNEFDLLSANIYRKSLKFFSSQILQEFCI